MKKLFVSILAAIFMLGLCTLVGCSGKKLINLKDYVTVEFKGYNGSGIAEPIINYDAIAALFKGENAVYVSDSFESGNINNNGKLSNGDTVAIKINYNEMLVKNSNAKVTNSELLVTVSGLKEKEKLNLAGKVALKADGISPECTVSIVALDNMHGAEFTIKTESDVEIDKNALYTMKFRDGEKLILTLTDKSAEQLSKQYIIENKTVELTVNCDSKYILAVSDLTADDRKTLDKTAEDFVNEKVKAALAGGNEGKDPLNRAISAASGLNVGTLYAGKSQRLDKLEIKQFNSAYVGLADVSNWGVIHQEKRAYYFYDADIKYYAKDFFDVYDEDTSIILVVKIQEPRITPEGIKYTDISFDAVKNIDAAKKYISGKMEKLS